MKIMKKNKYIKKMVNKMKIDSGDATKKREELGE